MIPVALSIAGSDPSGGAGIQADLKTFASLRVYGMAVLTALTAQNTRQVTAVHTVPTDFVRAQVRAVLDDIRPGAIKLGMLARADIAAAVAEELAAVDVPVVLDPVMVSTSGGVLFADAAAGFAPLVSRATLVTPNLDEAGPLFAGDTAEAFAARHGVAVLVKDGHGHGPDVVDRLIHPDGRVRVFRHPRIATRNTHGTGCTLSAAIAAMLARGAPLEDAVEEGLRFTVRLVEEASHGSVGSGNGPLLHHADGAPVNGRD